MTCKKTGFCGLKKTYRRQASCPNLLMEHANSSLSYHQFHSIKTQAVLKVCEINFIVDQSTGSGLFVAFLVCCLCEGMTSPPGSGALGAAPTTPPPPPPSNRIWPINSADESCLVLLLLLLLAYTRACPNNPVHWIKSLLPASGT